MDPLEFTCPRCGRAAHARFYGPWPAWRPAPHPPLLRPVRSVPPRAPGRLRRRAARHRGGGLRAEDERDAQPGRHQGLRAGTVDLTATLDAPCGPEELFAWVDDLGRYPAWLTIVT